MTGNKVHLKQYAGNLGHIDHIQLADKADLVLIAPATANTIAKLATGVTDNLLLDLCLVTRAPIMIAPAMNTKMWQHPTVLKNVEYLKSIGYEFIDPDFGLLACKHVGEGRLAEQDRIIDAVITRLSTRGALSGKQVLITLGGTREPIDPVRFITNRSSGLMGKALAHAALAEGAAVTLITSVELDVELQSRCEVIEIETADQMHTAALAKFSSADITIMAAAVADYKPSFASSFKLKKSNASSISLELSPNRDIIAELGKLKRSDQLLVGFALETDDLVANAMAKLKAKNLDYIVANPVETLGSEDSNIIIIDRNGEQLEFKDNKDNIARHIISVIAKACHCEERSDEAIHN
jgi:phosphopantothenoylcysteine decarboxylase/phosphopantothenate--cysteine ligase